MLLAFRHIRQENGDVLALDRVDEAAEALATLDRHRHLDADVKADPAREIGCAHQRAVDPRRGNLEIVGGRDRILDIEQRRDGTAHRLAVVDAEGAIRPFGHDLHGAAVETGNADTDKAETKAADHRFDNSPHAAGDAVFRDQPGLFERVHHFPKCPWICPRAVPSHRSGCPFGLCRLLLVPPERRVRAGFQYEKSGSVAGPLGSRV